MLREINQLLEKSVNNTEQADGNTLQEYFGELGTELLFSLYEKDPDSRIELIITPPLDTRSHGCAK